MSEYFMEDRTQVLSCGRQTYPTKLAIWLKYFLSKILTVPLAPWNITVKHEEERMTKIEFVIKKAAEI